MKRIQILALFVSVEVSFSAAAQNHYSLTYERFLDRDETALAVLGTVKSSHSDPAAQSRWSVGCECLDRDMAVFENYKTYVGELGVGYARVQSGWAKCEKQKGKYDFGWLDAIVDGLIAQGVRPWMCLCYGNPVYGAAEGLGGAVFSDKPTLEAWGRYVREVCRRYKGKVSMYEVWNEPCLGSGVKYASAYASIFCTTVSAIRAEDKDVAIAGLSLSGSIPADFTRQAVEGIRKGGKLHEMKYVTYHPYAENPDFGEVGYRNLRSLLDEICPSAQILQGEAGCPANLEYVHALNYFEWSEYSKAKWDIRQMATHFRLGVPASIFTMVDLRYKNIQQSFGMLRCNLLGEVIYKRPSFHAVQNMVALLPCAVSAGRTLEMAEGVVCTEILKDGRAVGIMYYRNLDIPSSSLHKDRISAVIKGFGGFNGAPVLVDPITGRVYDAGECILFNSTSDGGTAVSHLPLWDSPLFLLEPDAFLWAPSGTGRKEIDKDLI